MEPERWQRVQALLQDAIALSPGERPAFLDKSGISPDDRREIESLLAHHHDDAFLEEGPGRMAAALLPDRLSPGATLGPYRIVRELGRGGMGVVYLGHDTRLDREVAIKVLPAGTGDDPRRLERLRREARAAAAVPHAGVARIYAFEEDASGVGYVVSEYITGRTLREEIREGPLPPALAVATARQVAAAVAAAHARGIVHRDLKPENVMRAADGTVKVLDFGLARIPATDPDETRLRTATGAVIGTPAYMSPEQLRAAVVGPPTDIFALGVMLHEMLTGEHPFGGAHISVTSLMVRILESPPRALPPAIVEARPGIDAVVERCLQKNPAARFESMAHLDAALAAIEGRAGSGESSFGSSGLRHEPALAGPSAWWWRFHQIAVSVLYLSMIYPVWRLRGQPLASWVHSTMLLLFIAAAAVAITVRLHWVFTARVQPWQLGRARQRARTWIRLAEAAMALLLLAAAGAALVRDALWLAAIFATVAVCVTAASLLIEPATTEAAFGRDEP